MIVNNAQLMRELKESEEIKQVINHLTQDIIDPSPLVKDMNPIYQSTFPINR